MSGLNFFPLSQESVTLLTLLLPALLLTLGLAVSVGNDAYIARRHRVILFIICGLMLLLIVQNFADLHFQTRYVNPILRTVCGIVGYSLRPVILLLFCHIVSPKRRFAPAWALTGLNAAVYLTALFSRLAFWIDAANHFQRGPLNTFGFFVSLALLAWLLYLSIREFRSGRRRKNYILLLPALMIVGAVLLDYNVGLAYQPITFLTYAIVLSGVFYYIWLHLQFVQLHEQAMLDGQRVQLMLSQIQPHFLFNSLEAIRGLVPRDAAAADAAMLKFERYLRGNMESLAREELIPFEKELEHTRLYLELEQLRFPRELSVEYDLACGGFPLPPLTLQPLAENAVRHGVRGRKSGSGTVMITAREFPDRYEAAVLDDGPGFDPNAPTEGGEAHVGLANVRERLRSAGAKLRIERRPEGGIRATIIIPKPKAAGGKENARFRGGRRAGHAGDSA